VNVRIDSQGDWWEGDQRFSHPGVIAAFNQGVGLHPETGEAVVRLGTQWCYIQCDVTPFVVRKLRLDETGMQVHLNTGEQASVKPSHLSLIGDVLCVHLDTIGLARLSRTAQSELAESLVEDNGQFVLKWCHHVWPICTTTATVP